MGSVYSVADRALERTVALKRMLEDASQSEATRQRFVHEARVTGQLQHPNVVPVYVLAAAPDGSPYFLMQLIEGHNFKEWLAHPDRIPLSRERLERGLEIILHVCDALAFAHSRGVLHRDIKPENIMVGPHGRVYLMDWGLASRPNEDAPNRGMVGTLPYMSPEQARGEPIDERADVFGIGAVLYEVVSGRTPYGTTTPGVPWKGEVVPVSEALGGTFASRRMCQIVDKAVAPDRNHRYPSVEAFQADVRELVRGGFHLPRKVCPAGEVILRQGDPGDSAYLIVEGTCRVTQDCGGDEIELRRIGPGEIFGELALVLGDRRTATVTAIEDTTLLVIDRQTLHATGMLEGWSSVLLEALAKRFRELERAVRPVVSCPPGSETERMQVVDCDGPDIETHSERGL